MSMSPFNPCPDTDFSINMNTESETHDSYIKPPKPLSQEERKKGLEKVKGIINEIWEHTQK